MDWMFSHTEELNDVAMDVDSGDQTQSSSTYIDGPGSMNIYFLCFRSHFT